MSTSSDRAFVDFVERTRSSLLGYAWLLTGEQQAAEDLVQETYVRVFQRWRRVADGHPVSYARRVMSNLSTDRWRSRSREVLTDEVRETAYPGSDEASVDLVRALQRIAPRERQCVVLRHYLDQSEKETAATLGISVGAVKRYTSGGLAALRPLLREEERHV